VVGGGVEAHPDFLPSVRSTYPVSAVIQTDLSHFVHLPLPTPPSQLLPHPPQLPRLLVPRRIAAGIARQLRKGLHAASPSDCRILFSLHPYQPGELLGPLLPIGTALRLSPTVDEPVAALHLRILLRMGRAVP